MDLQTVAAFISAAVAIAGLNLGALKWLLARHDEMAASTSERSDRNAAKIAEVEKDILKLRAELPIDYVRREDWIRFGNTLEAKMDALRAEQREQLAALRAELLGKGVVDARVA